MAAANQSVQQDSVIEKSSETKFDRENNILYDILIFSEWPQEPEYLGKSSVDKGDEKQGFLGSWLNAFSASGPLPTTLQKFVNNQMPWHMALGGEGKILAVLQDTVAEIRSSRDDFGNIIGKWNVPKDPFPRWRRMCFSPDCSILAIASSNGQIIFFDLLGNPFFTVRNGPTDLLSMDLGDAVAGMVFLNCRLKSRQQWSWEFLVATYNGKLFSFLVSPTEGFHENHMFSLKSAYPRGVSGISYHPSHQLLFVSGWSAPEEANSQQPLQTAACGRAYGLTAWRLLSDFPHYKMITTLQEDMCQTKKPFLQRIPGFSKRSSTDENYILRCSISPSGRLLAAIHSSSALSLWHLPALRLKRIWPIHEQPFQTSKTVLPDLSSSRKKESEESKMVADLNWWSDEALILARQSGAVTVSSVRGLRNLLGQSAEPFEPYPQVSATTDRRFLVLESECAVTSKRSSSSMRGIPKSDDFSSDEEEEPSSLIVQGMHTLYSALYYVTDSERFQPPRKKAKILTRNFRLLCLKSTTPEELFARKLDNEEYGEALALAKVYGLDCDLVYQRQWRKTFPVSVASIQDYLRKIGKRSWVIHECLERVPDRLEAARGLLLYGLSRTDLQELDNRPCSEEYEDISSSPDASQEAARKMEISRRLLSEIDFKSLTVEQRQLCQYRLKLLTYLDRLNTYEIILGGGSTAGELFDSSFFKKFRVRSGLEAAVFFAREGNAEAVADMFTYHGAESLVHWLPILSNLPETMPPLGYRSLLPEAGFRSDEPEVYPWDEIRLRELDWCEVHYAGNPATPDATDFNFDFYEENRELLKYREEALRPSLLTDWYLERARQIEARCGAVDHSIELIKCGRERNVQGLEQLHGDLLTLETLVYECHLSDNVTLELVESISHDNKIKLLMQGSTPETFVRNCRQRLLPFLERLDTNSQSRFSHLLRYLVSLAEKKLHLCQLFLQASKPDGLEPLLPELEQIICVALECVYACRREDQLSSCCAILECLPERGSGNAFSGDVFSSTTFSSDGMFFVVSKLTINLRFLGNAGEWNEVIEKYHEQADELERHLMVSRILEEYGCPVTPWQVRSSQNDSSEVKKLLFSLANSATSRSPPLGDSQWHEVLSKMLDMQRSIFNCIRREDCYETLVSCLLCSSRNDNILLAGTLMQCSSKKAQGAYICKLPYEQAMALVLQAAEKYFNLAAHIEDPSIGLAKSCLKLMSDRPPAVERELDLIVSLSLLQEFSLNLIPLQVRLCKDRLDIIKQALRSKARAYGNIQKLIRLATLLRVCGEDKDEREGQVITLVADAAFEACDFRASFQACQQLMERRYTPAWTVCRRLGACDQLTDTKARIQLLSFSVTFCTPELIEPLIRSKQELELLELNELVKQAVYSALPPEVEGEEGRNGEHLLAQGLRQTKEISLQVLQSTHHTTRKVLATVGSAHFWKDAVKWIQAPGALTGWYEGVTSLTTENNRDFKKLGLPAFYLTVDAQPEPHLSQLSICYNRYLPPDLSSELRTRQEILRAALLEDSLCGGTGSAVDAQVLLDLCQQTMPEDTFLALAFLFALKNPADAEAAFDSFPRTALVLEVAAYFFCLCLLASRFQDKNISGRKKSFVCREEMYRKTPSQVVQMGEEILRRDRETGDGKSCPLSNCFLRFRRLLGERTQADLLSRLHERLSLADTGQFHIETFLADDTYKETVMLQLASSPEDVFVTVRSLAERYNISLWELLFRRLQHLATDPSVSVESLESETNSHQMASVLGLSPVQFQKRMDLEVLPFLDGADLKRLGIAYSLLEKCGDLPNPVSGIQPGQHLRLLKKLQPHCPGMNYLELMNPERCETVIQGVLSAANLQGGGFHDSSSIYRLYGENLFFDNSLKKEPTSVSEWVHRYEGCSEVIHKMNSNNFLDFVNRVTFGEHAVRKVPQGSRLEVNRRALKHSKHKEHSLGLDGGGAEWSSTSAELQANLDHLRVIMEDELVKELASSREHLVREYALKFDMTRSRPHKVEELVVEAVLDRLPLPYLQTLLALAPADLALDVSQAHSTALQLLAQHLSSPEDYPHHYLEGKDSLKILEDMMTDLAQDRELMSVDQQVELLSPLLGDPKAPATFRMAVADLLQKGLELSLESQEVILRCRSQCLVSGDWPEVELSDLRTESPEDRQDLFRHLLELSQMREQLVALAHLALTWPHRDIADESWLLLLTQLIPISQSPGDLDQALEIVMEALSAVLFQEKSLNQIFESWTLHNHMDHALRFAVLSGSQDLLTKSRLQLDQTVLDSPPSTALLQILTEKGLVTWCTGTPLYGALQRHLLVTAGDGASKWVRELRTVDRTPEAGTLLVEHLGVHPSLATFSGARATLEHWLQQE